jgi:hypothetical protein
MICLIPDTMCKVPSILHAVRATYIHKLCAAMKGCNE